MIFPFKQLSKRWPLSFRSTFVAAILASFLLTYLGAYLTLSRRGMAEAAELNAQGWLYVSRLRVARELRNDRSDFTQQHQLLRLFFLPLSWIDVQILGNPPPYIGGIWRLTNSPASIINVEQKVKQS